MLKKLLRRALDRLQTLRAENDSVADAALMDSMLRLPWILGVAIPLVALGAVVTRVGLGPISPENQWRYYISWIDMAMICWLLLVGVALRFGGLTRRVTRWGVAPLQLVAASVLVFTGALSIVDQWGRSTVMMYLLGCVFIGSLLLIRPAVAAALYLGSDVIFHYFLGVTQTNPMLLQANRTTGFIASAMGLLLSMLLWRKHTLMLLLQRELERQRQALEASNEELKQQQLQLEILAQRDALTGLFNRREFARLANMELLSARRHHSDTSIIMADLDFFKRVNDTHGHPAGDEVIKFMADTLRNGVRVTDLVSRMGGEEFIVLLPKTSMEAAMVVAEKLRFCVQETPIQTESNHTIRMTASFGVTGLSETQSGSLESLYAAADMALYAAKSRGRNRVETCTVTELPPPTPEPPAAIASD